MSEVLERQAWPQKTRELHNHHFDSSVWNDFRFRDDDIIISTYAKSGTTWMQQIVAQLLFSGAPDLNVAQMSPWLDLRFPSNARKLLAMRMQKHRRFLKTHLPVDALVYSPQAKYLYIGRDARDVVWSMYNHHASANQQWYDDLNNTPGLVGPPMLRPGTDIKQYWHEWLANDGQPWWPFWDNVRGWWNIRHLPNVMFVHFADLKRDMPSEIRRIAAFLDIHIDEAAWPKILKHCSFEWMKQNADKHAPGGGTWLEGGAQSFINQGVSKRWHDTLSPADIAAYESRALQELGAECAAWLKDGTQPA